MLVVSVGSQVAELNLASLPITIQHTLFCLMHNSAAADSRELNNTKGHLVKDNS